MKTAKIKSFDVKQPFKGQNSAFVGLDNKDWGFYEYEGEPTFKVGDEVFYDIEVKKSDNGKDVPILTLDKPIPKVSPEKVQTETKPPSVVSSTNVKALKSQATIKAMEFLVNMFIADKVTWDQIQPKHKELTGYLNDGIDECNA